MADTSISLVERLRLCPDSASWQRLVDLYAPMIRKWFLDQGLQPPDADDLVQEMFIVLIRELPEFHHDLRRGAFRRWLRSMAVNRLRIFWRTRDTQPLPVGDIENLLDQLEDPNSNLSRAWDQEHDRHVAHNLLELIEPEFEPATWQAFRRLVLEGRRTAEVAAELGVSTTAVRVAKLRILRRFRQEAEGFID